MDQRYVGIEIGGTKLQVVLGDHAGRILQRERFCVDVSAGGAGIRLQIEQALPAFLAQKPAAIGVGFGGPVDWETGKICCSHQIEGWSEFPVGSWLSELAEMPVVVDNDANVAALGEAVHGAGAGRSPVFYVTLGSGVGGGLVVAGKIYHGAKPGESEIGHIRLDRSGTIVEARCSGWAVDARIRQIIRDYPGSKLAEIVGQGGMGRPGRGEARFLGAALQAGDCLAETILNETATDLAFGLSHVTHLFHPELIVLGGGLSLVGEPLRAAVQRALPKFLMNVFGSGPEIALARLGEDAVPVGALTLAQSLSADLRR